MVVCTFLIKVGFFYPQAYLAAGVLVGVLPRDGLRLSVVQEVGVMLMFMCKLTYQFLELALERVLSLILALLFVPFFMREGLCSLISVFCLLYSMF